MHGHQHRTMARVVDQIDEYKAGTLSPIQALNNIWGLYTAAEIESTPEGKEFAELYLLATAADDARQESMPESLGTDADFEDAIDSLRVWVTGLGEPGAGVE